MAKNESDIQTDASRRAFLATGAGIAGGVLAATIHSKFSTLHHNLQFLSLTFVGMTLGALITGFLGDRFGRRGALSAGLVVFGAGSAAAMLAASPTQLIAARAFMGIGGAPLMPAVTIVPEISPPGYWFV